MQQITREKEKVFRFTVPVKISAWDGITNTLADEWYVGRGQRTNNNGANGSGSAVVPLHFGW